MNSPNISATYHHLTFLYFQYQMVVWLPKECLKTETEELSRILLFSFIFNRHFIHTHTRATKEIFHSPNTFVIYQYHSTFTAMTLILPITISWLINCNDLLMHFHLTISQIQFIFYAVVSVTFSKHKHIHSNSFTSLNNL